MENLKPTEQQVVLTLSLPNRQASDLILDYRRAVYLPDLKALLVADLHWGKGETFQKFGIPIPSSVLMSDLSRLAELVRFYQPERIFILGDLIHGRDALTPEVNRLVLDWRAKQQSEFYLIEGNHDRAIQQVAEQWGLIVVNDNWQEGGYVLSHAPQRESDSFNWCGHIHPTIRLTSPTDTLRMPCFQLTEMQGLLPAFSVFTGGVNIQRQPDDQVFVVGDSFILPV